MNKDQIHRPALGHVASIGDLYDIRTDKFLNLPLFHSLPPGAIDTHKIGGMDSKYVESNDLNEQFATFGIDGGLKLSILSGLVDLEGSGKYLQNQKTSSTSIRKTLMYFVQTKLDKLDLKCKNLEKSIKVSPSSVSATHFVDEIYWGANVFISAQSAKTMSTADAEGQLKINASLTSSLNAIASPKYGFVNLTSEQKKANENIGLTIEICGDIMPNRDSIHPQTLEEAGHFIASLPDLIQNSNEGKGVPIKYGLSPISNLLKHFQIECSESQAWENIPDVLSQKVVKLMLKVHSLTQQLDQVAQTINEHEYCVEADIKKRIFEARNALVEARTEFREKLRQILVEIRRGSSESAEDDDTIRNSAGAVAELNSMVADFEENDAYSIAKKVLYAEKGDAWRVSEITRLDSVLQFDFGVKCIRPTETLEEITLKTKQDFYILFYTYDAVGTEVLRSNLACIKDLVEENKESKQNGFFYTTKLALAASNSAEKFKEDQFLATTQQFSNGKCICTNVLEKFEEIWKDGQVPIVGRYELADNGNFEDYLSAIGVNWVRRKAMMSVTPTVTITKDSSTAKYTIDIQTSIGNEKHSFWLDKEFNEKTADGYSASCIVTKSSNGFTQVQIIKDAKVEKRIIAREFTKTEMIASFEAGGVKATRTFRRI